MTTVREPAIAGMFYPADPSTLKRDVALYISEGLQANVPPPRAIIAPHAGYPYSGPIAGSAYAHLGELKHRISRIVIMSPSHRVGFDGIAYPSDHFFRTPLGDVPVNHKTLEQIKDLPFVLELDEAHRLEHGIEVHLPFLQETLDSFSIVPLVVGRSNTEETHSILKLLWNCDETLILISSDLSHYLPYDDAVAIDQKTTEAIEALSPESIGTNQACGRLPICGLLKLAKQQKLKVSTVDVRNSGDTAGDKSSVVGYGAYVFHE